MAPGCFICGGEMFDATTPEYRRCRTCGHETLAATPAQGFIINDSLRPEAVERDSWLDRFQGAVLDIVLTRGCPRGQLVDIGSGSGRFLHRHTSKFSTACGIEITPEAVNFSRNTLGLTIRDDIEAVSGEIDVATAWHSLEHFPPSALLSLLGALAAKVPAGGCVLVSVPNAASFQYRLFRRRYAFFDVPTHLHQFTPDSLDRLFRAHGFVAAEQFVSWPYNAFGYIQALLNCMTREHNYVYHRLKRGRASAGLWRDVSAFFVLLLATPLGLALSLLDAMAPSRQGVLTWRFEKRA